MNRRDFVKTTALTTVALGATGRLAFADTQKESALPSAEDMVKGFVVADAHFGWASPTQPSVEVQAAAMKTIMKRFPGLDVFLDAGDATHVGATDKARTDWMRTLQCASGTVPYFLCAGNHDVLGWGAPEAETLCCELGSLPCKPYYSFDIKGIHFVVLPELQLASLVTEDTFKWLELDLDVAKEKTTIILTHNSVGGTTLPHDSLAYRRLAASRQMREFLKKRPNVVAWLHGHNHTWEMVRKDGKLWVSCGRIGGFDPPYPGHFGRGHLGGFYFEIGKDSLTVKGYSATEDKFFDELEGYKHLTQTLKTRTSFDPAAPNAYSYGVGGSRDGEKIPVYNHNFLNGGRQELYISGVDSPVFNENPDISNFTQCTETSNAKILPGYTVSGADVNAVGEDFSWDWLNPGLLLYPDEGKPERTISMPEIGRPSRAYYYANPGGHYTIEVECETAQSGPTVQVVAAVIDHTDAEVASIKGPVWALTGGRQTFRADFAMPPLDNRDSIFTKATSDNRFRLACEIGIKGVVRDVIFHGARLSVAGATGKTRDPAVTISGIRRVHAGELPAGKPVRFDLPGGIARRSVVEIEAGGSRRLSWLVRQVGPIWTVRNACVVDKGGDFEIDGLRGNWSPNEEVVVTPLARVSVPYLYKTRHVSKSKVQPFAKGTLCIEIIEATGPAEIEVRSDAKPASVSGADSWDHSDGIVLIKKSGKGVIGINL
jgi:hypothetical protein